MDGIRPQSVLFPVAFNCLPALYLTCRAAAVTLLSLMSACTIRETHPEYALYFDRDGYPIAKMNKNDPCADRDLSAPQGWRVIRDDEAGQCWARVEDNILSGLRASNKRALLFVHGGLNSLEDGRARVDDLIGQGDKKGTILHDHYPIFINWQASLASSYLDHLFRVRQGMLQPFWAKSTAPYILVKDLAFGAVRTLPDTVELVADAFQGHRKKQDVCFDPPPDADAYRLSRNPALCGGESGLETIDIRWGHDQRTARSKFLDRAQQVPWLLVKPFSTGFVIDGLGSESWSIMIRRTELMFHHEDSAPKPAINADSRTLTAFLEKLKATVKSSENKEIDFIAHSAGTLILNRALREVPDLPVANIVYMAAATSLEDYENVVLGDGTTSGYLFRHPDTQVYHLVLYPLAEVEENDLGLIEPQPRGSLLYWIDAFLADPQYFRQHTLGRAKNILARIEATPKPIQSRVHLKIFDYGVPTPVDRKDRYTWCSQNHAKCQPQRHSEFGEMPFWEPWFWQAYPAVPSQ